MTIVCWRASKHLKTKSFSLLLVCQLWNLISLLNEQEGFSPLLFAVRILRLVLIPSGCCSLAGYVEALASKLGMQVPDLTPKQVDMWQTRLSSHMVRPRSVHLWRTNEEDGHSSKSRGSSCWENCINKQIWCPPPPCRAKPSVCPSAAFSGCSRCFSWAMMTRTKSLRPAGTHTPNISTAQRCFLNVRMQFGFMFPPPTPLVHRLTDLVLSFLFASQSRRVQESLSDVCSKTLKPEMFSSSEWGVAESSPSRQRATAGGVVPAPLARCLDGWLTAAHF